MLQETAVIKVMIRSGDCSEIINSIIFQETIVQQVKPSGEDTVGGHDKKVNKGFHFPNKW